MSTLQVNTISESTSGNGINLSSNLGLRSLTTTQIGNLSGMTEGDIVYDSTLGTIKVYNGTMWAAMSDNTYTISTSYVVIAGGASGAPQHGGGGGAGGYRSAWNSENSSMVKFREDRNIKHWYRLNKDNSTNWENLFISGPSERGFIDFLGGKQPASLEMFF